MYAAYSGTIVGKGPGQLVIDHQGTGEAYATQYLHIDPGPKEIGDRVIKGEPIASVGPHPAGDHLHFELWSAPGWYAGGTAVAIQMDAGLEEDVIRTV